jgi:V8-like Glu-specific endopeptidase
MTGVINEPILNHLRNAVCAVGYLRTHLVDFTRNFEEAEQFEIVGTGFLVREEVVITNRHVIDSLDSETRKGGIADSQQFVLFVIPRPGGRLTITPRQIRHKHCLRNASIDIAFIQFKVVNPEHFDGVAPVEIDDPRTIRVSEHIAAFGYPHGNALLESGGRVRRWGPVLQQGWISGVSPWERLVVEPDEFLLDLRAAEGISGSPVFRPATGKVFGVIHSGKGRDDAPTTTAFAQPLSADLLAKWLVEFETERES